MPEKAEVKEKYGAFQEELREGLRKTGKLGNMSGEEYDVFKERIKKVPENGAGMNGAIYDFVERIRDLHGISRGTPYLHNLLDACDLNVPHKVVDALRSNTERLIWEQERIKQFLAWHPEFKDALG